jgi:hypothetical protein
MKKQLGFTSTDLSLVIIITVITVGWVWNIIKLFNVLDDPFSARIVLRMLGIPLFILGAIIGYF